VIRLTLSVLRLTLVLCSLVPIIEASIGTTPFALESIQKLIIYSSEGVFPQLDGLELAKNLTKSLITAMDITNLRTGAALTAEHRAKAPRYFFSQPTPALSAVQLSQVIDPVRLSTLFLDSITHSWDDLLMVLSLKIAAQASSIPPIEFNPLWLPFLDKLLGVLTRTSTPLSTPRYQQVFLVILESYLDRYVGQEPSAEVDWTLPLVGCHCVDCSGLNQFLGSATRTTTGFSVGKKRRQHLHQVLDGLGGACTHETNRRTYPETLVVTKKASKAEQARIEWAARFKKAQEQLGRFEDPEGLQTLLGADYQRIMGMEFLKRGQLVARQLESTSGGGTSEGLPRPRAVGPPVARAYLEGIANIMAGVKRKASDLEIDG
jgi:hypothetical protein